MLPILSYYLDGATSRFDSDSVSAIPVGRTTTETFTWRALDGTHTFRAAAFGVPETDETNNDLTITYAATLLADLVIESITWSPATPSVGDTVTFTVTIKNLGPGAAQGSSVSYYFDGATSRFGSDSVSAIPVGRTTTETFTWRALDGTHTFRVAVFGVPETDETNNELTITVTI